MSKGLLLLDVDGPLNPYAAKRTVRPPGYETFRYTASGNWLAGRSAQRYKGVRVWLNPSHGSWLRALAAETDLDLVWAATGQHEANALVAPAIGLDALPVIEFPEIDRALTGGWRRDGSWKWPSVNMYANGRPLAWLDDEHDDPHFVSARTAFDKARKGSPTLLCHIDPRHGLQESHLDEVRAWAAKLS